MLFLLKTWLTADSTKITHFYYRNICLLMFVRVLLFLWHIILFTASGVICCLYQHIDANSTSTFVSFCLGFVANRVKGVLESCVQCLSFNTIFCVCIRERV